MPTNDIFSAAHELRAHRVRDAVVASDNAYADLRRHIKAVLNDKDAITALALVDDFLKAKVEEFIVRSNV